MTQPSRLKLQDVCLSFRFNIFFSLVDFVFFAEDVFWALGSALKDIVVQVAMQRKLSKYSHLYIHPY
jgi:hypothetical protein